MRDVEKISFKGMMQDLLKSKFPNTYYFKGRNIRISNSNEGGDTGVFNENGNEYLVSLPAPSIDADNSVINYGDKELEFSNSSKSELVDGSVPSDSGDQTIIGSIPTRDSFILFSTDNNGFDCVWDLIVEDASTEHTLTLLYVRNLNFSINKPIQAVFNYENPKLQKIYWVDGVNQLRFLNIKHSKENQDAENLIDVNSNTINIIGEFDISQPEVVSVGGGGTHTAGVIQYAYNLYRINGAQTTISPLSSEIPLGKGILGGGELNEIVGESPVVNIPSLDTEFTHIKVYAIKYTSYGQEPSIKVIVDESISSYTGFNYYDTGASISTISLAQFLFLGGNPIIPKHIANKYSILFAANITENQFTFDIDARAYSHNTQGNYTVYTDLYLDSGDNVAGTPYSESAPTKTYNVPETHDAVNIDFDTYKYQANGSVQGGEGKFIKYELEGTAKSLFPRDLRYYKFFKSNEVYRIGIQFYNRLGQISFPKWIADFKAPGNNLNELYNTLKVTVKKDEIDAYIASLGLTGDEVPIGYKILRAIRDINDRTIICQGGLTPMMVQAAANSNYALNFRDEISWDNMDDRIEGAEQLVKTPVLFTRDFNGDMPPFYYGNTHLSDLSSTSDQTGMVEIYKSDKSKNWRQRSFLFSSMFQLHSPDILFGESIGEGVGYNLRVIGTGTNPSSNIWVRDVDTETLSFKLDAKITQADTYLTGGRGLVGPTAGNQTQRLFSNTKIYSDYTAATTIVEYPIKGSPVITERGQGVTAYNGEAKFSFSNSVEGIQSDKTEHKEAISSINSWGERSITLVLDREEELQDLFNATGIVDTSSIVIAEIVKPIDQILLGNIYGGNSYERKKATDYVEIGVYRTFSNSTISILSPGDIYAGEFRLGRLTKTDTKLINYRTFQTSEVLGFQSESAVNIYNRNDLSLQEWDAQFQPEYNEYHAYNKAYSSQPSILPRVDSNFKFKAINEFDTRIMASKEKIPGEFIDSWTDFLDNEVLDLEGKYGDINGIVNSNNELYAFQDTGVAHLTVKPNVQLQASDGITLELGRGGILYDYNYISSSSGSLNKWSIITSPTGFYYYDALNKAIMVGGKAAEGRGTIFNLSNTKGFRSFLVKHTNYNNLVLDNPLLKTGVTGVFNTYDKMMYMTFLDPESGDNTFTICFSENDKEFTSFFDFTPSIYLHKGFNLISTDSDNASLYKHGNGNKGEFYGEVYPSKITLLAAPKADLDKTFTNLFFKSECSTADGTELPGTTIDSIKVWNEHQTTGEVVLSVGRRGNIQRKFRNWAIAIPKVPGTRQRVRNPWAFIELGIDNYLNNELILHDILVNYNI